MLYKQATILIADDSGIARRKIVATLREAGYSTILQAENAEQALKNIEILSPDLFLLDILMPGLNGLELCKIIKETPRFKNTPVLMVTGSADVKDHWESFEFGADDYIPKPFHPRELLARVDAHLDRLYKSRANWEYAHEMESLAAARAQQLIHADRLSSLGVLMAEIVHEIKNPLTYVAGNAQFLQKITPEALKAVAFAREKGFDLSPGFANGIDTIEECVSSIRKGVTEVQAIIENIRTFARRTTGDKPEPLSLAKVVEKALAISHHRLKFALTVENNISPDLPPVPGTPGMLEQVFVNLCVNAADAVKEDPTRQQAKLRLDARLEGEKIVCTVRDTGPGMTAEIVRKLWEPFFTTKSEAAGTGLGLSISRQIVESVGGEITIASEVGVGTTFTVTLPLYQEEK
jgi:signal transduction histidine kinase